MTYTFLISDYSYHPDQISDSHVKYMCTNFLFQTVEHPYQVSDSPVIYVYVYILFIFYCADHPSKASGLPFGTLVCIHFLVHTFVTHVPGQWLTGDVHEYTLIACFRSL